MKHVLWPVLKSPSWSLAPLGFIPKWPGPRACAETPGEAGFRGQDNYTNSPVHGVPTVRTELRPARGYFSPSPHSL